MRNALYCVMYARCMALVWSGANETSVGVVSLLQVMFWSKVDGKRVQDTAQFWRSQCGMLLFIQWMDKTRVCVLSSFHEGACGIDNDVMVDSRGRPLGFIVERQRKSQAGAKEWAVAVLPQPTALFDYSKNMGGVDDSDQVRRSVIARACVYPVCDGGCAGGDAVLTVVDIFVVVVVIVTDRWLRTIVLVVEAVAGTWPSAIGCSNALCAKRGYCTSTS